METITGRVDAIEAPTGQAKAYQITISGEKYRTIKPEVYGGLVLGQTVEAVVNEVPGKGTNPHTGQPYGPSWFLEGWKAVEGILPVIMPAPEPVKGNWETAEERAARNRSIAMMHAQKVAAEYCGESDLDRVRKTAWVLYADVQRAWAGDDFSGDPVPREPSEQLKPSELDAHFGPKKAPAGVDPATGEIQGAPTDLLTALKEAATPKELHKLAQEARGLNPAQLEQVRNVYNERLAQLVPSVTT